MCTMIVEQAHACAARGDRIPIVLRDRGLSSPDGPDYLHKTC
jgi:hypothetical protein